MKHIKTYLPVAVALLALSCTKQEGEPQPPVDTTPVPLAISVGVQATSTRSVVTGTAFPHGQEINVILNDAGETSDYNGVEMPYRFTKPSDGSGGVWMPVLPSGETKGLMLQANTATLLAHYPAVLPTGASVNKTTAVLTPAVATEQAFGDVADGLFESFKLKVDSDPNAAKEDVYLCKSEVDYLTGSVTPVSKAAAQNNVTIPMKHSLAMVVFRVDKDPANSAPCEMRNLSLTAKTNLTPAPMVDGTFSIINNAFTKGTTAVSYRRTMSGFAAGTAFGMLIYPATIASKGDVVLEFQIDYSRYRVDIPAKEWTSGSVTLYKMEIVGNEAILNQTINIKEWPAAVEHDLPLD